MASRKRSREQMVLVEGVESWHMSWSGIAGHLQKIVQYQGFDHPKARDLTELEAREALEKLREALARSEMFWSMVYESEQLSFQDGVKALREAMEAGE